MALEAENGKFGGAVEMRHQRPRIDSHFPSVLRELWVKFSHWEKSSGAVGVGVSLFPLCHSRTRNATHPTQAPFFSRQKGQRDRDACSFPNCKADGWVEGQGQFILDLGLCRVVGRARRVLLRPPVCLSEATFAIGECHRFAQNQRPLIGAALVHIPIEPTTVSLVCLN